MRYSAPLLLALTVAGCSAGQPASCPADFDAFLARYSEDAAFQRELSAPVVIQTHLENVEPEPRTVTEHKSADTLVYLQPRCGAPVKTASWAAKARL